VLAKELESSTTAIIGTFAKLTVAKDYALRKVIREAGGQIPRSEEQAGGRLRPGHQGGGRAAGAAGRELGGVYRGRSGGASEGLCQVGERERGVPVQAGIVDGKLLTVDEVKALATMPGKEELFAKLLFLINAPAQRLATVINAAGKDLAVALGQGVEKEKFASAA